jgi:hypothetical protein
MTDGSNPKWALVGDVEWDDEYYQFNLTRVYREDDGSFRWSDDSGCSCPMPFESHSEGDYAKGNKYELLNYLGGHYNSHKAMDLIERVQAS